MISLKLYYTSIKSLIKYLPTSVFGKKLKPRKSVPEQRPVDEKQDDEKPAFAGLKLKKATRIQRQWDEPELETVELVKQKFESLPHSEEDEQKAEVVVTNAQKLLKQAPKKKKKPKAKTAIENDANAREASEMEVEEKPKRNLPEDVNMEESWYTAEETESQTSESPFKIKESHSEDDGLEDVTPEAKSSTEDIESDKSPLESEFHEVAKKLRKPSVREVPEPAIDKDSEEAPFASTKLKKAVVMPKALEEQDVEKVHLRKHQFEMNPSDEEVST